MHCRIVMPRFIVNPLAAPLVGVSKGDGMNDVILCFVALGFLAWVFILRMENSGLKADNQKLRSELERFVRKTTKDIDVVTGSQSWGKAKDGKTQSQQHPM